MGAGLAGGVFSQDIFQDVPRSAITMTWIRTVSLAEADEKLRKAIEGEKTFYPKEYAEPVHPDPSGASSIVGSHTLIPEALYHAFATFGSLMSPDLPLDRRKHEMIATMVSVTNRCVY
jgi:alkylhydroperoxidase family enzyme